MPRPPRARDAALDAAERLFLQRGVAATSLDDVCAEAGISKGALFYHFSGKDDLAAAAVRRFGERLVAGLSPPAPGREGAAGHLVAFVDAASRSRPLARGCLLGMATMDCATSEPGAFAAARDALDRIRDGLAALVRRAAAETGVDADADAVAALILSAVEGGLLLDRHHRGAPSTRAALQQVRAYLELLFVRHQKEEEV